ncbi:hypothetical protein F5X96DRAFT_619915 [Biscogniauxia mediterranea]|nr:hypothetical protein F5X96DRAFT_619915 [Biscogniauxia mediterranea]
MLFLSLFFLTEELFSFVSRVPIRGIVKAVIAHKALPICTIQLIYQLYTPDAHIHQCIIIILRASHLPLPVQLVFAYIHIHDIEM